MGTVTALLDPLTGAPLHQVVLVVGLLMVVDTTAVVGLLVPSDLTMLSAAAAVGPGGAPALAVVAAAGSLVGWSASFALGRRLGTGVRRSAAGRLVPPHRWEAAERMLAGRSARALLLLQFLPVVNALIPLLAGALGMPYRRFITYAAASTAAWATVFAALGSTAGSVAPELGAGVVLVVAPVLLVGSAVTAALVRPRQAAPPKRRRVALTACR